MENVNNSFPYDRVASGQFDEDSVKHSEMIKNYSLDLRQ